MAAEEGAEGRERARETQRPGAITSGMSGDMEGDLTGEAARQGCGKFGLPELFITKIGTAP